MKKLIFTILACLTPSVSYAATNIYYSVGQNTTDHKTGSPTITISGNTATFSVAQTATNMGIGDKVVFGGDRVFITGKTSTTVWSVQTATGTTPVATTSATVSSINHSFSSVNAAVGGGVANNATSTNFLNTSDLVAGNYILNIPCYFDTGSDQGNPIVRYFTTDKDHYIRIYTPTSTDTEVNQSQRHRGYWDLNRFHMASNAAFGYRLDIRQSNVVLDGLQIANTGSSPNGGLTLTQPAGTQSTLTVSNSILLATTTSYQNYGISFVFGTGSTISTTTVYNNFISGWRIGLPVGNGWFGTTTIYNNTIYDVRDYGIQTPTFGVTQKILIYNNIVASTTYFLNPNAANLVEDYNSTTASTTRSSGPAAHDRVSQTFSFTNAPYPTLNLQLTSSDTGARDFGVDLSTDTVFSFNTDIVGAIRPYNSIWDIGASEMSTPSGVVPGAAQLRAWANLRAYSNLRVY